jgi:hypothetical protein
MKNILRYIINMAKNSSWVNTVKNTFKMGKKKNSNYTLRDAMIDAKKVYKKGETAIMNIANKTRRRGRRTRRM